MSNMRPEDRLAEKLKNDTLGTFFSDEDLLPIAKRAIDEAFFKWRDGPGYNSPQIPPLIVTLAKEHLEVEVKAYVARMFEKILDDEQFQNTMSQIMVESIGTALVNKMEEHWLDQFPSNLQKHAAMIADIVRSRK